MPDSVSKQLFVALDELIFVEDAAIQGIHIDYSARNEARDRQIHRLLENALVSEKIPKKILESAYKHFKSLLKGFLSGRFDREKAKVRKYPSLTREEKETIFTVVSKTSLIAIQTILSTIDNDDSSETNEEIGVLTKILGLNETHSALLRVLFEDAYKDAILELIRGEVAQGVQQIVAAP